MTCAVTTAVSEPYVKPQVARVTKPQVKSQPATTQEPQPMRKGLMDNLRKAGDAVGRFAKGQVEELGRDIRKFDDAYAAKVGDLTDNPFVKMTSGFPVTYAPAGTMQEKAVGYGILGANAAARYALPAGGVTLAGKGLYDLTQMMMGQQTSGTIDPE